MKQQTSILLLTLCLASGFAQAGDQASFDAAYTAAEEARKKADSVGGEWRDTAKFLKQAKALAEKGEFEAAIKLAKKAEHQGHAGYEQMTSQAGKVGPEAFLQ